MDSYFKAAVCDLDKLLDDFEQNTDESDSCRAVVSTPDVNHHSFPSDLRYFQQEIHAPKLQHSVEATTKVEPPYSFGPTAAIHANLGELNCSPNGKNVTGLDLLSTVDGGTSDEIQPSSLGRGGVPVCDLISDTGNLIHTTLSTDIGQEPQPDDFPFDTDYVTGLDVASLPAAVSVQSSDNGSSSTQDPKFGGIMLQDELPVAVGELGLLDLKTDGHVSFKLSKLCLGESETNVLEEEQQQPIKRTSPIPGNLKISNSDDITVKLLSEPLEIADHLIKEKCLEGTLSKTIPNEDDVSFEVRKTSDACKASAGFKSEECETSEFSNQNDDADKCKAQVMEEHLQVPEFKNINATIKEASSVPGTSTEEVHTSLSCLPIAVSLCGSLVATEDTDSIVLPEDDESVIHDSTSASAGTPNSAVSDWVSYGTTEHSLGESIDGEEEKASLNQVSQAFMEKEMDIQPDKNGDAKETDVVVLPHLQVISAFPAVPETENKPVDVIYQFKEDFTEVTSISTGSTSQDFKSDNDDLLTCDLLISDAELDAFLNEQTVPIYNPNPSDEGFSEPDARHSGFLYIEDSTAMEHNAEIKNEPTVDGMASSSDGTSGLIDGGRNLEEPTLAEQSGTERGASNTGHEALTRASELTEVQIYGENNLMVHGGARPKQLFDLPPRLKCDGETGKETHPCIVAARTEKQIVNCVDSSIVPVDDETSSDTSLNFNRSGLEIRSEADEGLDSASADLVPVMEGQSLGHKQPSWVPDSEAPNCMHCQVKFTFTKRRHHCRACGKVFCAVCCNRKCKLQYMEKEARVCVVCHESISKGPKEQKRVWFADGVLPNGELADTTKLSAGGKRSSQDHSSVNPIPSESLMVASPEIDAFAASDVRASDETSSLTSETEKLHSPASAGAFTITSFSDYRMLCGVEKCVTKDMSLIPDDEAGLPPLLLATGEKGGDAMVEERPCHQQLMSLLEEGGPNPLTFILNANLLVNVKLVSYSSEKCWFFSTNGLHGVGQAEIIMLLLCLPHEDTLPKDIFKLFLNIYKDALKGKHINNLENVTFTESFLGSKDHGGILFITPTFQNLDELPLPNTPFLCGILIQKMEVPWAKVFPIRVMLRLGAEYGVYPCPVVSIRNRKPLYGEVGHTIMNLLADLRNYQYTLPNIDGLFIHMEMGTSCIKLPIKKYNEVLKVINSSNEHVISIGASFSMEADSHLVCVQNDDGVYQTQANSSTGQPRKVTGASFVIFNGALKTSSGFIAKSSIVEDGLMVQITPETMEGLRQALREKKDFRIECGKVDQGEQREDVKICWFESEDKTNKGVISPIDGQSLEGILSAKMIQEGDFETNDKLVKCTEVFYLLRSRDLSATVAYYEIAKEIATTCSAALCEHLRSLKENGMNKVALRISMDIDVVEYQAGSGGRLLPQRFLNYLDGTLIPVIHGRTSDSSNLPLVMELVFFLLENLF